MIIEPVDTFDAFCDAFSLSGKERDHIAAFDEMFLAYQAHTNLIARPSVEERWSRHYADSAQLFGYLPAQGRVFDMGSGGGFPGVILAILAATRAPDLRFLLCDSVQKKARFLSEAAEQLGLANVTVSAERAEVFHEEQFDVMTARAVASLEKLLPHAAKLVGQGGLCIFPKGQKADSELTEARKSWTFTLDSAPSMTHSDARILLISELKPTT